MDQRIPGADTPLGTTRASELDSDNNRSRGEQVKQKAREMGGQAAERLSSAASDQVHRATGELGAMASALRDAGGRLSGESMMSGKLIQGAAEKLDELSRRLDNRDLSEMVTEVRGWARRNPGAFIGAAVAVGFLASRFMKASETHDRDDFYSGYAAGVDYEPGHMDTELYRGELGQGTESFGTGSTGGSSYGTAGGYGSGAGYSTGMDSGIGSTTSGTGAIGSTSDSGFSSAGTTDRGFTGTSGNTGTGVAGSTGSTGTRTSTGLTDADDTREGGRDGRS